MSYLDYIPPLEYPIVDLIAVLAIGFDSLSRFNSYSAKFGIISRNFCLVFYWINNNLHRALLSVLASCLATA